MTTKPDWARRARAATERALEAEATARMAGEAMLGVLDPAPVTSRVPSGTPPAALAPKSTPAGQPPWPRLSETLPCRKHPDRCQKCGRTRAQLDEAGLFLIAWQECAQDGRDTPEDIYLMLCTGCNKEDTGPGGKRQQGIVARHPRFYVQLPTFAPVPGIMAPLCVDCTFREGTHCAHPDRKANGGPGTLRVQPARSHTAHYNFGRSSASGFYTTYEGPATACSGRVERPEQAGNGPAGEFVQLGNGGNPVTQQSTQTTQSAIGGAPLKAQGNETRLIEFHPGEGSRYLLAVALLRPVDAHKIGGSLHTVLISFGTEEPGGLQTYFFEATPAVRPHLFREYFEQKMPRLDAAAKVAGIWVVADLLGREACAAKHTPEELDWSADWRDQLAPLRAITLGADA